MYRRKPGPKKVQGYQRGQRYSERSGKAQCLRPAWATISRARISVRLPGGAAPATVFRAWIFPIFSRRCSGAAWRGRPAVRIVAGRRAARPGSRSDVDTDAGRSVSWLRETDQFAGQQSVKMRVPAGSLPGQRLRLSGKGQPRLSGARRQTAADPADGAACVVSTRRQGYLSGHSDHPWEAALGTTLTVPTLSGNLRLKVPAGARSGQKLRLTGRGMPASDSAGDLLRATADRVATGLSDEERALYERCNNRRFNPRVRLFRTIDAGPAAQVLTATAVI
jgi:hypothetical protein